MGENANAVDINQELMNAFNNIIDEELQNIFINVIRKAQFRIRDDSKPSEKI